MQSASWLRERPRLHFFDPRLVDLSMVFQDNLGILYVRLVHLGQSVPAQCLSSRSGKPGSPRFLKSLSRTHLCTARLKKFTSTRVSNRSVFQTMLQSVMPTSLHFFVTSSIAESPLVQPSPLQYTRDHAKMQVWSSPATASLIQHLAGLTTDPGTMAQTCST